MFVKVHGLERCLLKENRRGFQGLHDVMFYHFDWSGRLL